MALSFGLDELSKEIASKVGDSTEIQWEPVCKLSGMKNNEIFSRNNLRELISYEELPDCNCRVDSVDKTVNSFVSPLLSNLTKRFSYIFDTIALKFPKIF